MVCDANQWGCLKSNVVDQASKVGVGALYLQFWMDFGLLNQLKMIDRSRNDRVLIKEFLFKF